MSMQHIRDAYGVPAKRGGRLIYTDCAGVKFYCTIKSATQSGHLRVLVDDRVDGYRGRIKLHPTWNVEYIPSNVGAKPKTTAAPMPE
jgi:hypothetical protein